MLRKLMFRKLMFRKSWFPVLGFAIATVSVLSLAGNFTPVQATTPVVNPSRAEVCAVVNSMPGASNTETLLTALGTDRQKVLRDLMTMKSNMERFNTARGSWPAAIEGSTAPQPRPGAWLIGALKMTCETNANQFILAGTVIYRQRIALPPTARVVVRLEDVSRADAPSTVIAEDTIQTAGRQVPIPFSLTYGRSQIESRGRYSVRAQIFDGDRLRWTSTTVNSVDPLNPPSNLVIQVEQVGN